MTEKFYSNIRLARELVEKHVPTYAVVTSNEKQIFGFCNANKKVIGLSKYLLLNYTSKEVMEVVLHEIAHALTPNEQAHGKAWKAMCIKLGIKPDRIPDINVIHHVWEVTCRNKCFVDKFFRKPKTENYTCVKCDSDLLLSKVA